MMMHRAQGDEVVQIGGTSVFPLSDMVGLAPADGAVTADPGAGGVHRSQGVPLGIGGRPVPAADVDRHTTVIENDPADHGVAGEAIERVRRQVDPVAGLADRSFVRAGPGSVFIGHEGDVGPPLASIAVGDEIEQSGGRQVPVFVDIAIG